MLEQGKHKVLRVKDHFMSVSKEKKTPFVGITFELENNQETTWLVYLSENENAEKAVKGNIETIIKLGFTGKSLADLASDTLMFAPVEEEITVTIEHEEYEGKTRAKVKFVNLGSFFEKIEKAQAVTMMKSLSFDGWFAQAKKSTKEVKFKKQDEQTFTVDDIPF